MKSGTDRPNDPSCHSEKDAFERCVLCGKQTEVRCDTPIDFRGCYVEGAGQLCPECWRQLYGGSAERRAQ